MAIPQHDLITTWYRDELHKEYPQSTDAVVVTGFPLWDEAYVRRFLDYTLPSMRAPANRAVLDADAEFVLYVDKGAYEMLLPLSAGWWDLRLLPEDVLQLVHTHPGYKYTLLTAVHNLLIHQAARTGAAFMMGVADIVYSNRYFERLLEHGQKYAVIGHLAPPVSERSIKPWWLDSRWKHSVLDISASILGSVAWHHASGLFKSWLMNDATFDHMPLSHFLVWRGRTSLRMHCPHISPVWLNNERCCAAPLDINDTIDAANGPRYMGDQFYVPQLSDDMTCITVDDLRDGPSPWGDFNEFKARLDPYSACMAQFKVPVMVPTLPATDAFLPDDVIEARWQKLASLLGV